MVEEVGGNGGGGGGRIWREGGARICTLEFRLSLMLEKNLAVPLSYSMLMKL